MSATPPSPQELFDAEAAAAAGTAAADAIAAASGSELPSPSKQRLSGRGGFGSQDGGGGGPAAAAGGQRRSAFMLSSVGARFRRQLQGLMATLGQCQPHYIR